MYPTSWAADLAKAAFTNGKNRHSDGEPSECLFFYDIKDSCIWGVIIAILALTAEIAEYFGVIQWL